MEIKSQIRNKKALIFTIHHPLANPLAIAQVEEFKELVRAAGLKYKGLSYQVIKKPHPATFIGTGKIQELKKILEPDKLNNNKPADKKTGQYEATPSCQLVVFNCSLSGVQIRNLERHLGVMVIDRNQLILDIFAQRARTYAGKLQVELARTLDELPRMVGAWMSSLSRQKGGIGTKGPGEKALEKDRRQVKIRARKIEKKLEKIRQVRKGHRALRKKNKIPGIALIGYTNSGKSTLLNSLTNSLSVTVKSLPFMTLDPTTRKVHISRSQEALVTDTVGFIQDLSPHLIEAFKATLEESASADILLHVIDLSSPLMKVQMDTVNKFIADFGWEQKPCIHVYNKIDIAPKEKAFQIIPNRYRIGALRPPFTLGKKLTETPQFKLDRYNPTYSKVFLSALKKTGFEKLKKAISDAILKIQTEEVQLYFPRNEEDKIYSLDRKAFIYKKEVSSLGILCHARMTMTQLREWENFIVHPKKT
ncbi:MAG: GTPase HflX [Bdellovibrionales bacterium]|nr:GTPase HflX [Bdellovibrionales bacterium]